MYFIINKTKNSLSFPDLNNIILGPRQAIDLDKMNIKREVLENSKNLKLAKSKGHIEIRVNKAEKNKNENPITSPSNNTDINKAKEEIINEIKGLKKEESSKENFSKEDMINIFKELISSISKEKTIVDITNTKKNQEEEIEINDELISEMNIRAINKTVKNAKTEFVDCKEEKQQDNLLNNINELEELIG